MSVQVYIENDQTVVPVDDETLALIERVIAKAAELEQVEGGEVSVVLIDDAAMLRYNAQYRGVDRTTDVLSFSMLEGDDGEPVIGPGEGDGEDGPPPPRLLGDILISMPRARAQAEEYGHSFQRELGFLVVHGFLHLLGYDHDTPEREQAMFSRQEQVLTALGLTR